jgi:hypothetical protein
MARGMVPACRDNRPMSSTGNHRKTTPDRLTEAYLPGPIYGLTPFPRARAAGVARAVLLVEDEVPDGPPCIPVSGRRRERP